MPRHQGETGRSIDTGNTGHANAQLIGDGILSFREGAPLDRARPIGIFWASALAAEFCASELWVLNSASGAVLQPAAEAPLGKGANPFPSCATNL